MTDLAIERAARAIHRTIMPVSDSWEGASEAWRDICRDAAREAGRALKVWQPDSVRIPHLGRVNEHDDDGA